MPIKDYITGTTNRILIGTGGIGLIVAAIAGLNGFTRAYVVHNSSGQNMWSVDVSGNSYQSGALVIDHVQMLTGTILPMKTITADSNQVVSTTDEDVSDFQLKMNGSGQVALIWTSYNATTTDISTWASTASFGGSWGTPVELY